MPSSFYIAKQKGFNRIPFTIPKFQHYSQTDRFYIEHITRYLGNVYIRPGILYDIDRMNTKLQLSHKWEQRCTAYEIKFASPITVFEEYSFKDEGKELYEALLDKALLVAGDMSSGEILSYMKPISIIPKDQIIRIKKIGYNAHPLDFKSLNFSRGCALYHLVVDSPLKNRNLYNIVY